MGGASWTQARVAAAPPTVTRYATDAGYRPADAYDVEFSGARGDRIRGLVPCARRAGDERRPPVVVKFIGYGGGRGLPANHTLFPSVGYPPFVMDTRGQGGRWTVGATGDLPAGPGVLRP